MSDGDTVTRVEAGFSSLDKDLERRLWKAWDGAVRTFNDPTTMWSSVSSVDPTEVVHDLLGVSSAVPRIPTRQKQPSIKPLVRQGAALAELFYRATSPMSGSAIENDWKRFLIPCVPVVIVECNTQHLSKLPKGFVRFTTTNNVEAAFGYMPIQNERVGVWYLGIERALTREIRSLRLCLLRLHAEVAVLHAVLERIASGSVLYEPRTPAGDKIENYLNEATRLIDRTKWGGVEQSTILGAFDVFRSSARDTSFRLLTERLSGARLQIRRKLEKFQSNGYVNHFHLGQGSTYVADGGSMSQQNISHSTITNSTLSIIEGSQVTLGQSNVNTELKSILDQLLSQAKELAAKSPSEKAAKANEVAENVDALVKEVARPQPRRAWYELSVKGLKEAAEAVGEIGKPILETAAKLLPLLVTLFK